jgi:mannitol 2-dehydrogenase
MVDRITPATTDADREQLETLTNMSDQWPVATEPFTQWVLEDNFAAERPPVETLGVILTDDVEPYERMKLQLLNAGHSCLAYLAALAGYEFVHDAMGDEAIRRYLEAFLSIEAAPVVPPVPGIDLDDYQASLIERFSNPAISDQIARLCLDGTAKFPKFLLPTVRSQLSDDGPIALSALALAGWCRYLQGVADDGSAIDISPDPQLEEAVRYAKQAENDPAAFLAFEDVFGTDLASNDRLVVAFSNASAYLAENGVASTIDSALSNIT